MFEILNIYTNESKFELTSVLVLTDIVWYGRADKGDRNTDLISEIPRDIVGTGPYDVNVGQS